MKGYVAHPVLARKTIRLWEQKFEKATGIELVNPFIDVEREPDENLHASESGDYSGVDAVDIVEKDLAAIKECDFVVAFVTGQRSYGTIMEIAYASIYGIPVYIVCANGHEDHPWLMYHAEAIFENTAQFKQYIMDKHAKI